MCGKHRPHNNRYKREIFRGLTCIYCCFCGTSTYRNCINKWHLATIEHIIPIVHGGSKIDKSNMAISCWACNQERQIADFIEFRKFKQGHRNNPPILSNRRQIYRNNKCKNKILENEDKLKSNYNKTLKKVNNKNYLIKHCCINQCYLEAE